MARINIEERWWTDIRRSALIRFLGGDEEKADGAAVRLWRVAIEYWTKQTRSIPKHCFDLLPCATQLLEAKLAVVQNDEVYVKGASECFDWVVKKSVAGKKGGLKSAQVRLDLYGTNEPNTKHNEADTKHIQPKASTSNPLPLPLTLTQIHKEEELKGGLPSVAPPDSKSLAKVEQNNKASQFIASYVTAYKTKYGGRPDDINKGAVRGQILLLVKDYDMDRLCQMVQVYFQMECEWFGKKGHDFMTFSNNLNKIGHALDSGEDTDSSRIDYWNTFDWAGK